MLRTHWQYGAAGAVKYLAAADYYASSPGELLGRGFDHLDIQGMLARDVFEALCHNLDPKTGQPLRPLARDGERVGMDFTFNSTKSVGIARELAGLDNAGDPRIEAAHREAVAYTMGFIERDMQTRVRGGRDGDRLTGNLVAYRVTHRDTRISAVDQMPDMSLHDHVFVLNTTFDPVEQRWKAAQVGQIKHDAPYYEAIFHNRLASNLRDLGYGVRRKDKAFEIMGVSDELVKKFSRRRQYIKMVAEKLGITSQKGMDKLGATTRLGKTKELADDLNGYYVSRLTAEERQQLAGLEGKPSYLSSDEKAVRFAIGHEFERRSVIEERKLYETAIRQGIGSVTVEGVKAEAQKQGVLIRGSEATTKDVLAEEGRIIAFAREGRGTMRPLGDPRMDGPLPPAKGDTVPHRALGSGVAQQPATLPAFGQQKGRPDESRRPLAIGSRSPVVPPLGRLHATSERDVSASASSGVSAGLDASDVNPTGKPTPAHTATLSPDRQAVSDHLAHARNVIDLSHEPPAVSKGSGGNLSFPPGEVKDDLSPDQLRIARHVWDSTDRVILIRGAAGTGKTHTMKATIAGIDAPVAVLAPTAEASRGVLRREGFEQADTVAAFLGNPVWQNRVKGGVIFVDEAGLLPIRDLSRLTDVARQQDARIILQGDPKQHKAVPRHGNMFNVLQEFAGLPVAELRDIRRQRGKYKEAVAAIDNGEVLKAHDLLDGMGCIRQVADDKPLVDDYLSAVASGKSVLVVAPTHAEGDAITGEIRARMKTSGKLALEDHTVRQLVNLNWSEAERGDLERYDGTETLVFHRNSGTFKAGQKVRIADWKPGDRYASPSHFSVYAPGELHVAAGDTIRITANGKSKDGHKLTNGSLYRVKGFDKNDNMVLDNGWTVAKDYGHVAHGYVSTSHAAQGKTVDRVLIAMGGESIRAINAEQFYVSVSRGKESARIYSDLPAFQLREAIQKADSRKSATELMRPKRRRRLREKTQWLVRRGREIFYRLRDRVENAIPERQLQRDYHAR